MATYECCLHEAAHAVAAWALGLNVVDVTVEPEGRRLGLTRWEDGGPLAMALISLSGAVAESHWLSLRGRRGGPAGAASDFIAAEDALSKLDPSVHGSRQRGKFLSHKLVRSAIEASRDLITGNFRMVRAIANELMFRGSLNCSELLAVLAPSSRASGEPKGSDNVRARIAELREQDRQLQARSKRLGFHELKDRFCGRPIGHAAGPSRFFGEPIRTLEESRSIVAHAQRIAARCGRQRPAANDRRSVKNANRYEMARKVAAEATARARSQGLLD